MELAGPIPLRIREAGFRHVNDNECARKINTVTEKIFILPASSFAREERGVMTRVRATVVVLLWRVKTGISRALLGLSAGDLGAGEKSARSLCEEGLLHRLDKPDNLP